MQQGHSVSFHLNRIAKENIGYSISYSPTLTDKVFVSDIDTKGSVKKQLTQLLKDTDLTFAFIGDKLVYVYPRAKKKIKPQEEKKEIVYRRKKVVQDTAQFRTISYSKSQFSDLVSLKESQNKFGSPKVKKRGYNLFSNQNTVLDSIFITPMSPRWALKTNLIYDVISPLNVAIEYKISRKRSISLSTTFSPFIPFNTNKFSFVCSELSLKEWNYNVFNGFFYGVGVQYSYYHIDNLFNNGKRYRGNIIGGGFVLGYQSVLNEHIGFEYDMTMGYMHISNRGEVKRHHNWFGPINMSISLVYIFK